MADIYFIDLKIDQIKKECEKYTTDDKNMYVFKPLDDTFVAVLKKTKDTLTDEHRTIEKPGNRSMATYKGCNLEIMEILSFYNPKIKKQYIFGNDAYIYRKGNIVITVTTYYKSIEGMAYQFLKKSVFKECPVETRHINGIMERWNTSDPQKIMSVNTENYFGDFDLCLVPTKKTEVEPGKKINVGFPSFTEAPNSKLSNFSFSSFSFPDTGVNTFGSGYIGMDGIFKKSTVPSFPDAGYGVRGMPFKQHAVPKFNFGPGKLTGDCIKLPMFTFQKEPTEIAHDKPRLISFENVPYTGCILLYDNDGIVECEKYYKNGYLDGVSFYDGKFPQITTRYKKGIPDGGTVVRKDSQLFEEMNYVDGKMEGVWDVYYYSKEGKETSHIKRNMKQGICELVEVFENGELLFSSKKNHQRKKRGIEDTMDCDEAIEKKPKASL